MTAWRVQGTQLPDGTDLAAGVTADGAWTTRPPDDAEPLPGRYVLPGLVDAHSHLSVAPGRDGMPKALDLAATRAQLERAHAAGVTGIRDTGSPGSLSLRLGPEILASGRFLAPPGRYIPALLPDPVPEERLVDAALAEIAAGARWIKLVGDFPRFDRDTRDVEPTYSTAAVVRLIEAAHAAGARVAAHTTGPYATELIAAGVDSVEHGTALTEADLGRLAERGAAWTPTLCASLGDNQERLERLGHLLRRADQLGVTILTGSDVVGTIPAEVALLTSLGLSPAAALAAATTNARRFLDLPGLV